MGRSRICAATSHRQRPQSLVATIDAADVNELAADVNELAARLLLLFVAGDLLHAAHRCARDGHPPISFDQRLMYAPLLANRYLTSRIIPMIAATAVALCVALVIIVVSVMTGFLDMVRTSGKTLIGDVVATHDVTGISYYQEFIRAIEALPEAVAASPIIETFGLLQMPYGPGAGARQLETVQVWGIEPESLDRVANYRDKLYWRAPDAALAATLLPTDPRLDPAFDRLAQGMSLTNLSGEAGVVLGIEISAFNERQPDGSYQLETPVNDILPVFMPDTSGVTLTLVPVSDRGSLGGEKKRRFAVVNEFQSGVYQIDAQRVLAPLNIVQEMLRLDPAPIVSTTEFEANGRPKVIGESPARATTIVIRAAEGVTPQALAKAVREAYATLVDRLRNDPATATVAFTMPNQLSVMTWEERLADLIGPVEKERELMRTLFSIVYIVSAALVLAIFWAIVQEKTRDIGILRAVGASRAGILWIFLRYGLLIGLVGSIAGVALAWTIVARLNEIHGALGSPAPLWLRIILCVAVAASVFMLVRGAMRASALRVVLWTFATLALSVIAIALVLHQGFMVWDPSVYYFSRIPSQLDWVTASTTMVGGILFSVVGAAIPAAYAADTDPVQSLRFE